jgi:internalin A
MIGCQPTSGIKDDNLKREVSRIVNYEGVPVDEITYLDASYANIESLEGIEALENLEHLTLSSNMIQDLTPLSELKNLKLVDIQNNRVTDLSPLKDLSSLEVLLIRNNPIESVEVIENLFANLKTTDFLVNINFEDENLEALVRELLALDKEQLTYYDLDKLRVLDLSEHDIKNLSGIEHARNLEQLIINKPVSNTQLIEQLVALKKLVIKEAELENIDFVRTLDKLEYLDISYNNLRDVSAIDKLDKLIYLDLKRNKVSDVSVINSPKLETLYIEGNYISDYNELPVLDQIKETDIFIVYFNDRNLDLAVRNQIGKKDGVLTDNDLKNIRRLIGVGYEISSLQGIELLENLIEIDLSENNIEDLTPLEPLKSLQILKLKNNNIDDITSLIYLDQLNIVDLSFNEIKTIEALTYLPNLDYLYLEGNEIEDNVLKNEIKSSLKGTDEW